LAGAAYLVWLGINLWRAKPELADLEQTSASSSNRAMFWNAYIVTALNPKSIVFFVAFVPQFVNPSQPVVPQFVILELTFLVLAALGAAIWAILAGHLRERFRRPETLRRVNSAGAGFLIGAGVLTAATQR
ncbi:MAG: LysE family translocator, partial [Pseudomonadota bacterium]